MPLSGKTYLSYLVVQLILLEVFLGWLLSEAKFAHVFLLDELLVVLLLGLLPYLVLLVVLGFRLEVVLLVLLYTFLLIDFLILLFTDLLLDMFMICLINELLVLIVNFGALLWGSTTRLTWLLAQA